MPTKTAKRKRAKPAAASRKRAKRDAGPSYPLSLYSDELSEMLGGFRTVSGVRVNRDRALGYPAVWRAVSLISGDVAKLPLWVYRLSGPNKQPDPKHPVYQLLRRKPNDLMTAFAFKQAVMVHVLLAGNGYAYIDRDGSGRPVQLLLLRPQSTVPLMKDDKLWYVYTVPRGEQRKIPPTDILHIKGMGFDGIEGFPVLRIARDALGAAIAARDHSARYFKNGARPGGVLSHPGKLSEPARQRMRESWATIHQGLENAHKIAILEEGTTYTGFDANAKEAQLLESREFDAREIANIFGVPTHKLGDPSKVAYNSLGEENQSYYDDTLSRWLQAVAEECHDKLLTEQEKADETHCIDFDYKEIERANLPNQVDYAQRLFSAGIIDKNEARAVFGLNPVADSPTPATVLPGTPAPAPAAPPPAPPEGK